MKRAIGRSQLAHALLFTGARDSGQKEAALWLAQTLFCREGARGEACGACIDCRQALKGSHADLFILAPEKDAQGIKVEEVRSLITRAGFKPLRAPCKVFIIEEADRMNEIAQNALLKTLEEPPGHAYFVLIASALEKILVTIRSRVQTHPFLPRAVETALDEEEAVLNRELLNYAEGFSTTPPDLTKLSRDRIAVMLDTLIEFYRGAFLMKAGAEDLTDSARRSQWRKAARRFRSSELERRIELLGEFRENLSGTIHTKLALSVLWDRLNENNQ